MTTTERRRRTCPLCIKGLHEDCVDPECQCVHHSILWRVNHALDVALAVESQLSKRSYYERHREERLAYQRKYEAAKRQRMTERAVRNKQQAKMYRRIAKIIRGGQWSHGSGSVSIVSE